MRLFFSAQNPTPQSSRATNTKSMTPLKMLPKGNQGVSNNPINSDIVFLPGSLNERSGSRKSVTKFLTKTWIFLIFLSVLIQGFSGSLQACHGRFVNPVKDICWSCLFPLSIGPVTVNKGGSEDTKNPKKIPCMCNRPPLGKLPGIPVGFWEPVRLVDVTRKPFCMVNLGGISLGGNIVQHGGHGQSGSKEGRTSFYHVHWYIYPVIYWLELIVDFLCLETMSFDVAYMTELDPLWNDDVESFILNPEAALFGNPVAQLSCVADCAAATAGFPLDTLFWCNGCQGSLYPFTGNNASHIGGVQSSLLMVGRMAAKLHRQGVLWGTIGKEGLCQKYPMPVIKKSQYKTQMTFPIPQTRGKQACNPIGRTDFIWGSGKEFPYKGEDFGYLIWRKRNCCVI